MSTPLCPYFGKCGGCTAQHIDYALQLENKKRWVQEALNVAEVTVFSDQEYFYRNRMDFWFNLDKVGLREKDRSWNIVDIEKCVISDQRINSLLQEVRTFYGNLNPALQRVFHGVMLRAPRENTGIVFVLKEGSASISQVLGKIKEFVIKTKAQNVVVSYYSSDNDEEIDGKVEVIKGTSLLTEQFMGKWFEYPITGFFQNNSQMAQKMLEYSHRVLEGYDTKSAQLLDLYGGVGTFGIVNANLFPCVTIVENSALAITAAKQNILENRIKNATAQVLDAKQLRKVKLGTPLFVITDPPRTGMDIKVIQYLNMLQPEVILYVSCNVQQLAKEISKFKNYELKSAALFDLFPQTPHCEVVVELKRK